MHWPKVQLKACVFRLNTIVRKLRNSLTNEQPEDRSFGLSRWRFRNRCRDSSKESGESMPLNVIAASEGRKETVGRDLQLDKVGATRILHGGLVRKKAECGGFFEWE